MTLLMIVFICLLVPFSFIVWRIYLIRKTIRLVRGINELYALWKKRRKTIELYMKKITEHTACEWLLIQKELFVTFNSEKDRIQSEEKITSYLNNIPLHDHHELALLNRLIESQTYRVQRLELAYNRRLDRLSHWNQFIGLKPITFLL